MSAQLQAMIEAGDPWAIHAASDGHCDLCGDLVPQEDVSVEAFEATGFLTCTQCLEDML